MEEELMEVKDNVVLPMQMWELYKGSNYSSPLLPLSLFRFVSDIIFHLSINLSIYLTTSTIIALLRYVLVGENVCVAVHTC
jgi:hypothetical protein